MMSLSQTVGYAVLALGCIAAGQGERVLSTQIHKCTGLSMPDLRKTLFFLRRAGLIQAKRGQAGGFVLTRPADKITLLEVALAIGESDPLPECLLELPGCSDATPCPLRSFWKKERARIAGKLDSITIAQAADATVSVSARWGKLTSCFPNKQRTR